MAQQTPLIQHQQLYLPGQQTPLCPVGSPDWFAWLQTATTFRFASSQRRLIIRGYGPLLHPISLRKEQRRHGTFWYAYRRVHRQLYKRYVGRSDQLTLDRLDQVASLLHDCW
jgi:LuxR family maltose regulon positive regulatory protein